jgi:hypothetical protein
MTPKKNPAAVALGRLGGRAKSAAKSDAVRRNGKLGGRPPKTPQPVDPRKESPNV